MLNEHKIALFNAIQRAAIKEEIPLTRFESSMIDDEITYHKGCFVISVRDTALQFWIWPTEASFDMFEIRWTRLAPGFPLFSWQQRKGTIKEAWDDKALIDINGLVETLDYWCRTIAFRYLKNEKMVDPWEQLNLMQPFFSYQSFRQDDFEYFSPEEKVEMRQSLLEFKRSVYQNYKTTKEQRDYVEERLEYLSNAVDRLNRFDWKSLAISTVVGIGINLAVDTQTGPMLMRLLEQAFHASGYLLR